MNRVKTFRYRLWLLLLPVFVCASAPGAITRARVPMVIPSSPAGQGTRADESPARVAWARAAHLRRGVNLSHWFAQSPGSDYSEKHLQTHTTERDIAVIKSIGFDHVRPWSVERVKRTMEFSSPHSIHA